MRSAAPPRPLIPADGRPARLPRTALAAIAAAVVLAHVALLGWLPVGSTSGQALEPRTLHLATRVLPAPPPPPAPRAPPRKAAKPVAPQPEPPPEADTPSDATASANQDAAPAGSSTDNASTADPAPTAPAEEPPAPAPPQAPPPPPIGLPAPVLLRYTMNGQSKGLTYHAGAELLWQQDGAHYSARMEVSAFLIGSRMQSSEGTIGPGGLEPERFADKARRETATHFDRAGQRVVFSSNAPEQPLPPGVQDRLSVFLQLSAQLAGDPSRYPQGSTITMPTASTRDVASWTFVVGPQETLDLPIGAQPAVKLERAPRKEYDSRVEVWLAPNLGYLPVRMRITQQNGDFIEQLLKSAERPVP